MEKTRRAELNEEALDVVTGGLFNWNEGTGIMTYTHDNGSVTKHAILDYDNAWYWSNQWHAQGLSEDVILAKLRANNFVK